MDVPVVSRVGNVHRSRVGLTLLTNVGLQDLATPSRESYIQRALELAADDLRLTQLRRSLRSTMEASKPMDRAGFVRRPERTRTPRLPPGKGIITSEPKGC